MKRTPLIKRRSELINCYLFLLFALTGYGNYYFRQAPPERSLWIGVAFSAILVLYGFLLHRRRQAEN